MRYIDWAVLAAFVLPTTVVASIWATRDLSERSHLWSGRPGGWLIALRYWLGVLLILVFCIGLSVLAAAAFQVLTN